MSDKINLSATARGRQTFFGCLLTILIMKLGWGLKYRVKLVEREVRLLLTVTLLAWLYASFLCWMALSFRRLSAGLLSGFCKLFAVSNSARNDFVVSSRLDVVISGLKREECMDEAYCSCWSRKHSTRWWSWSLSLIWAELLESSIDALLMTSWTWFDLCVSDCSASLIAERLSLGPLIVKRVRGKIVLAGERNQYAVSMRWFNDQTSTSMLSYEYITRWCPKYNAANSARHIAYPIQKKTINWEVLFDKNTVTRVQPSIDSSTKLLGASKFVGITPESH